MAVLKCKMCGGNIEVSGDARVIECEYCGTNQTIPDGSDEKKVNLFNRANRLRMDCEFDKAAGVYESIVSEYPEESEGYWGLCLCKFGIEYVDDAKTGKKIPTCHRTNATSIMDDSDFEQALENADVVAKSVYREEAKAIDRLQRQIISVVESEEPYDVFICYKETDDITKQKTEDSTIAQDIYTELVREGYKVFFSRITLRDKAGTEYEPYIYAALKSAKVMLAIGTKYEYYDAVWVKNEWSRYIAMMSDDSSKHLIPCFKNLDAYDIPKEFKNLQALDMGEVTFFKNLMDNVSRFIPKAKSETVKETVVAQNQTASQTELLLKRVFMFLEEGNFKSADEYCEKVLDLDPENARAYLGKLMVELELRKEDDFANVEKSFGDSVNYQKMLRFGYDKPAEFQKKIEEKEASQTALKYKFKLKQMELAETPDSYILIARGFEEISHWKDSAELARKCRAKAEKIRNDPDSSYRKQISEKMQVHLVKRRNRTLAVGSSHMVGLRSDGMVVAAGLTGYGQCNVSGWHNIVSIAVGSSHTVGLRSDGTVVATQFMGLRTYYNGQCNVRNWTDIVEIAAGEEHTVGLRSDGTVVATKSENYLYREQSKVDEWKNIVAIATIRKSTVGLCADGTVVCTNEKEEFNNWTDIVMIEGGSKLIVGLRSNGTIVASGGGVDWFKIQEISNWTDIVSVSVGGKQVVGLKADGTVVATQYWHPDERDCEECKVSDWTDIVAIAAGEKTTAGLRSDGTIVVCGKAVDMQREAAKWTGILLPPKQKTMEELVEFRKERDEETKRKIGKNRMKAMRQTIAAGGRHTVGLRSDGTVVACGDNEDGQCEVYGWRDIVAIAAGGRHTVGLRSDGTVVACGFNLYDQCNLSDWRDIVAIDACSYHTVGLRSDGTVICEGNHYGQHEVSGWTNVIAIATGRDHTVGLKADGTAVACGDNKNGQCKVIGWTNVIAIATGCDHTVGLCSDGTVVACGDNEYGQCDVSDWRDIVAIAAGEIHTVGLCSDGTVVACGHNLYGQCDVSDWRDIVAIVAGEIHMVGLCSDGTVVACGDNGGGQCEVSDWRNIELPPKQKTVEELLAFEKERSKERVTKHRNDLISEKETLTKELSTLGFFAMGRKKEINTRLSEIERELQSLNS